MLVCGGLTREPAAPWHIPTEGEFVGGTEKLMGRNSSYGLHFGGKTGINGSWEKVAKVASVDSLTAFSKDSCKTYEREGYKTKCSIFVKFLLKLLRT